MRKERVQSAKVTAEAHRQRTFDKIFQIHAIPDESIEESHSSGSSQQRRRVAKASSGLPTS